MTRKDKQVIKDAVSADHVKFKKDGSVEFKTSYFYRHGQSAEAFADRVAKAMNAAGFTVTDVEADDKWAAWPKTSYFVATMRVEA